MMDLFNIIKDVAGWLFLAIIGIFTWFFKSIYSQHNAMHDHFQKTKDFDYQNLKREMENIKFEITKVEFESKRYWNDHKNQMESNHQIILERINHMNENTKANSIMIKDLFNELKSRIDKLEN